VIGIEAEHEGRPYRIHARRAVVLATGGFDHNLEWRRKYQPPLEREWSMGSAENMGDGIRVGQELGAATDLMDDAWWMPCMEMPGGQRFGLVAERQYPGQFMDGKRFVNESTPYVDFVHAQLDGHRTGVGHIPGWMIVDDRAFKRNIIAGHFPGTPLPKDWVEYGLARTAPTIEALAAKLGIAPAALRETTDRFNRFAKAGKDEDFHRGDSAYDRYYGDPSYPNPNLAEVSKGPFYAFAISPGDLGTKGGLVTDENARVLREDGSIIAGLYATGNTSASVMGNNYAGPGATIGPAMTFGYVAARHIAGVGEAEASANGHAGAAAARASV
jgi:3-oxosteroid 1-dehydrogenase